VAMPKTNPAGGPVGPVDIGVPTSFPQGSQKRLEALSAKPVGHTKPAGGPGIYTPSLGTVTKGVYTIPEGRPHDTAPPDPTRWAPIAGNPTGGPGGTAFQNRAMRAAAERVKFAGQPPVSGDGMAAVFNGGPTPRGAIRGDDHHLIDDGVLRGGAATLSTKDWRTWLDAQDGPAAASSAAAPSRPSTAALAGGAVWKMDPSVLAKGGAVKRKRAPPGPDSSTARRSAKVRELCKSHGMTVPQASSYIKTHGIKW
jgi:hypothetical protein